MPSRPHPSSSKQFLQCLRTRDELPAQPFNHFLLLPRIQHRNGYMCPGPLEGRRRAVKRRNTAVSAASSDALPLQGFGALFGIKWTEAPRPDFESRWRWEAPSEGGQISRSKSNGDWRPWMQPATRTDPSWEKQMGLAQFLQVPEDRIETSTKKFEQLLATQDVPTKLEAANIEDMLVFLQSAENERDAQLTLRLVQWLSQRELSADCSRSVMNLVVQKLTLQTMSTREGATTFLQLLQRHDARLLASSILDALPGALLRSLSERITTIILTNPTRRQEDLESWLRCLAASKFSAQSLRSTSEIWAAVYHRLSRHHRLVEMVDHFRSLDDRDVALLALKHWVPRIVRLAPSASRNRFPHEIAFKSTAAGWVEGRWDDRKSPNSALGDLLATLVAHKIPHVAVLEEILAYWEKTLPPAAIVRALYELFRAKVPLKISPAVATSTIRSAMEKKAIIPARSLLRMLNHAPVEPFQGLIIEHVKSPKSHGAEIWPLVDRWAAQSRTANPGQESLSPEIVLFVHKMAMTWAQSPHLRPRVAYRRVWECFRFLAAHRAPMYPSLSAAAVRAGALNVVQAERPLSKLQLRFVGSLVHTTEGPAIREKVDSIVFDYWRRHRRLARRKPHDRRMREKRLGMQYSDQDQKWSFRPYRPRVTTKASNRRSLDWRRQKGLFDACVAREQH